MGKSTINVMFNSYVKLPEGIMIIVPWFIPPVHIGSMKHTTQCWLNPINFDSENTDENHVFFPHLPWETRGISR